MSIFPQNTSFMMENEVAQREDRNTSEEGGDENDNWQLNMPHRWCCSNTNNCGIAMDGKLYCNVIPSQVRFRKTG